MLSSSTLKKERRLRTSSRASRRSFSVCSFDLVVCGRDDAFWLDMLLNSIVEEDDDVLLIDL